MKKFLLVMLAVLFVIAVPVYAGPTILTLYSGAPGTTSQVTGNVVYAPFTVAAAGCDILTSPTVTVSVLFKAGNAITTFRSEPTPTFSSSGLAAETTCTTGACNVQFTSTFTAMNALVTASTSTVVVTVKCSVR